MGRQGKSPPMRLCGDEGRCPVSSLKTQPSARLCVCVCERVRVRLSHFCRKFQKAHLAALSQTVKLIWQKCWSMLLVMVVDWRCVNNKTHTLRVISPPFFIIFLISVAILAAIIFLIIISTTQWSAAYICSQVFTGKKEQKQNKTKKTWQIMSVVFQFLFRAFYKHFIIRKHLLFLYRWTQIRPAFS